MSGTALNKAAPSEEPTVPIRRPALSPPPGDEAGPLPPLDAYDRLEVIGRGGMGVVYRAYDRALGREVALKALRGGSLATPDERRRFWREAQAAAQVRHPNIVPVLALGSHQGEDCIITPLYTGGTLLRELADGPLPPREACALVGLVARAVHAAHLAGVIHRDLKPSNILLDSDGVPHVADFGASSLRGAESLTCSGTSLGTPAYMAPEQTRDSKVGPPADVWALGAILYECLCGSRPFDGRTPESIMDKVRNAPPPPPRTKLPSVPPELEAIALRCLAKSPEQRFASAADLADDLERWLQGRPVRARAPRGELGLAVPLLSLGVMAAVLLSAALLAPARPATPGDGPPEKPGAASQAPKLSAEECLRDGKPWTLLGPLGMPTGYRWRIDNNRRPLQARADIPLTLDCWSPTQMELLSSVPRPAYRFRAEVAVVGGKPGASGGLYAMGKEGQFGGRLSYTGFQFVLVRVDGKAERPMLGNFFYVPPGPREGKMALNRGDAPGLHNEYLAANLVALSAGRGCRATLPPFAPHPQGAWHRLELEVTPARVAAYLDGLPAGAWARKSEAGDIGRWWKAVRAIEPALPPGAPNYPVTGSLGLLLDKATVRVRNVSVSPTP